MQPDTRTARSLEALTLLGIFGLLVVYVSRSIWDIDVFWHMAAGRAIVDAGGVPRTDIFSAIDPERTWVSFQWGYEVLVHGLDQAGGLGLVKAVHSLTLVAAFAVLWHGCRRRLHLGAVGSMLVLALLMVLFEDRFRVRPHVFNLLAWTIALPWLLRGPGRLGLRASMGIAVVMAIWANLHAGGAFLFLVAASTLPFSATVTRVATGEGSEETKRAWIWFLAAALPALLAPHFIEGNIQALSMLEGTESAIGEWKPSWHFVLIASTLGHWVCGVFPTAMAVAWLVVALPAVRSRFAQVPFWTVLLSLALLVLAHRSVRFVYAAGFAAVLLWPHLPKPKNVMAHGRRLAMAATAVLVLVGYDFNVRAQHGDLSTAVDRAFVGPPLETRRFPTGQATFLEGTQFEGKVFCQANWGGYLLWRLWPDAVVTADGRGNYPADVTADLAFVYDRSHFRDAAYGPEIEAIYARYGVDIVVHQHPVWPKGYAPDRSRWVPVYSDDKGAIWVHNTATGRAYLERLASLKWVTTRE